MKIYDTKFYEYVKIFFKENNKELDGINNLKINEVPYDSVDRLYALYIIDTMPKLLEIDLSNQDKIELAVKKGIPTEIKEEFELVSNCAYNNYERESMTEIKGYINLVNIAKKGREETLRDSYSTGGWFGSS